MARWLTLRNYQGQEPINIFIIVNIYDVEIIATFQNIYFSESKQSIYVF